VLEESKVGLEGWEVEAFRGLGVAPIGREDGVGFVVIGFVEFVSHAIDFTP
jgi:hypothetical protein